jgi:hypothetical protein
MSPPGGDWIFGRDSKPLSTNGGALQHVSRDRGSCRLWHTTSPSSNLTKTARSTFHFPSRDPGRFCLNVSRPFNKVTYGACQDVSCPIRTCRNRNSQLSHAGSSARTDNGAPVINIFQGRRCLEMDIEAMESRKGQVGTRNREMGRLSEAVEGSKFDGPKELVVSRVLHDQLTSMSRLRAHADI